MHSHLPFEAIVYIHMHPKSIHEVGSYYHIQLEQNLSLAFEHVISFHSRLTCMTYLFVKMTFQSDMSCVD